MKSMILAACVCAAAAGAGTAQPPSRVAAPPSQAAMEQLAALEKSLEAQPDDLRAGNDYRMAVIKTNQYDRALKFFAKLVADHPDASNAHLNYGFEYVDKIPVAGSITQVILANNALGEFTKALELHRSWIGYYTRGNSYLFWPRVFMRTKLGIDDLQEAMKIQKAEPKRSYHVRTYIALGDGYWKEDDTARATSTWRAGLAEFPANQALQARIAADPDQLKALMDTAYDPARRVDTSLQELWSDK